MDKRIVRYIEDPPEEQFEATWLDALALLEAAGPRSGFILMTAQDNGERFGTTFAISSGEDRISAKVLSLLLINWLDKDPAE